MYIQSLHYYPVKSLGGHQVAQAQVALQGMVGDREWLIVDDGGRFLTARTIPELLLWQTYVDANQLTITVPSGESCTVSIGELVLQDEVVVWKDHFLAWGGCTRVDEWLSQQLGRVCRLYYLGSPSGRQLVQHATPLSFADGAPYLLTQVATLNHLNSLLVDQVSMECFRSNIVVDGGEAYAEQKWKYIRIGEVEFECIKPCVRCVMTTIDLATGQKHPKQEPLKTLARTNQAIFGVNLVARNTGLIAVGDSVEVLA